jgi:hypothetical protein
MKNLIPIPLLLFSMLTISPVLAQPLISGNVQSSNFGGPSLKVTQVNDESVILLGGRGGVILNQRFAIGAGVYSLLGKIEAPEAVQTNSNDTIDLDMDYVGLDLEYIVPLQRRIHFSMQTLIATGRAQYWEGDDTVIVEEGIFVLEPGANLMVNITTFFRIGLGASYRFVSGVERLNGLESRDLNEVSANLVFMFGKF